MTSPSIVLRRILLIDEVIMYGIREINLEYNERYLHGRQIKGVEMHLAPVVTTL